MLQPMKSGRTSSEICCGNQSHQNRKAVTNIIREWAYPAECGRKYYCPMHCEGDKVYEAGDCPVCGMDLVKAPDLIPAKTMYTCPMHPEIIQEGPGSCPICGMDLVPMEQLAKQQDNILT
jgi:Cu2+-exporting ATPase